MINPLNVIGSNLLNGLVGYQRTIDDHQVGAGLPDFLNTVSKVDRSIQRTLAI